MVILRQEIKKKDNCTMWMYGVVFTVLHTPEKNVIK